MAYIVEDTGAKLIFAGDGFAEVAREIAPALPAKPIALEEAETRGGIAAATADPITAAEPMDAFLQLDTSGTTGKPKGAAPCQRNFMGPARARTGRWAAMGGMGGRRGDPALHALRPTSAGPALAAWPSAAERRAIVQSEFTAEGALQAIGLGTTRFFIVPAALQMLIQHPIATTTDFSRLEYVLYGAAPIPLELLRQAVTTIPNASFHAVLRHDRDNRDHRGAPAFRTMIWQATRGMRSIGRACPGMELRIIDSEGREVPRGNSGARSKRALPPTCCTTGNCPKLPPKTLKPRWSGAHRRCRLHGR